jgi:hypothetical protein
VIENLEIFQSVWHFDSIMVDIAFWYVCPRSLADMLEKVIEWVTVVVANEGHIRRYIVLECDLVEDPRITLTLGVEGRLTAAQTTPRKNLKGMIGVRALREDNSGIVCHVLLNTSAGDADRFYSALRIELPVDMKALPHDDLLLETVQQDEGFAFSAVAASPTEHCVAELEAELHLGVEIIPLRPELML